MVNHDWQYCRRRQRRAALVFATACQLSLEMLANQQACYSSVLSSLTLDRLQGDFACSTPIKCGSACKPIL